MTSASILVLNGPNLNMLGTREPDIYGRESLDDHMAAVSVAASTHGFDTETLQSNSETELVSAIQAASGKFAAIIINAGALTHYSWSLHDALRSFPGSVIEVHLSNPSAREGFRHTSVLAGAVDGSISGFGGLSYVLAVEAIAALLNA
jgi:3-dehydroquinate dehydratase-2